MNRVTTISTRSGCSRRSPCRLQWRRRSGIRDALGTHVWKGATALCLIPLLAAAELTPEHQLALTSLKSGERERLEKAAGPLDEQPLYRAAFDVDPEARKVNGTVVITYYAKARPLDFLYLRVAANTDRPAA